MEELLYAGWASVEITPPKAVSIQGQGFERISQGVHDPLFATALALKAGQEQAVLVACDLIVIRRELVQEVRKAVCARVEGLRPESIMLNAIHTHTAPYYGAPWLQAEYEEFGWEKWKDVPPDEFMTAHQCFTFLVERISQAVEQAWNSCAPAKIASALGHAAIGYCRRVLYTDGTAGMYSKTDVENFDVIEAGCDHGVELLYVWNDQDQLTGVVANVACPAQVLELKTYLSADYMGQARRMVKEQLGEQVYFLPQISAAGDQSPRDLIRRSCETRMHDLEGAEELGLRVTEAVLREYPRAEMNKMERMVFNHRIKELELPIRRVSQEEIDWATQRQEALKNGAKLSHYDELNSESILERAEMQKTVSTFPMELHTLRLGDIAMATNSFELFLDYGQRIKARSKAKQTFLVQLCGADGIYVPTKKAIQVGSYGAAVFTGIVGYEGGNLLVEESVAAINGLF